jgi:two-component system sensor histidine kinase VicK
MPPKSIKSKIIKITIWLTLIITIIASAGMGLFLKQQAQKDQRETLLNSTQSIADKLKIFLNENNLLVKGLATSNNLTDWFAGNQTDTTEITAWLNNINFEKRYSAIYLLNQDGIALASTDSTFIGKDYSFRKYAQEALAGKNGFEMAIGVTSHQPGYYFSAPSKDANGKVIGVLVFKLIPQNLHELLIKETQHADDKIMLCDANGVIIYSNITERIYSSLGELAPFVKDKIIKNKTYSDIEIKKLQYQEAQQLIEQDIADAQLAVFYDSEDRINEVLSVAPIQPYDLFLTIEVEAHNFATLATTLGNIGALLLLALALVLVILITLDKFLEPINQLKTMANNISQGHFSQINKINSKDELEDLGKAIEEMSGKLKNYYSDLENGVELKTKELKEKAKSIESAKKAIMNILEDVEAEKDKNANMAKDLEKFKLALDHASDLVVITDREGLVIYANGGTEAITGYSAKEAIGTKAGKAWGGMMSKPYYDKMWKIIKTDKKIFSDVIKNKRKNGDKYDAQIAISPVLNNKQEVEFFVCIERDITKEREIDRAKTEFVSLASHQLRTPLSSINWYSEMLLAGDAGKLNKSQKEFVEEIRIGNQRMVNLVNSLLNVSRLEMGTFVIDPKITNIIDICESVLNELISSITTKNIKITKNYAPGIPLMNIDPSLTRIIFQNLLSNAIKYTPEKGSVKIEIKKDNKDLNIIITDNGYGIPIAQQDKIFNKLFRADNVKILDTEGTGLGLYIIKSILDNSNGKINFKSEENKGSEFTVTIPLSGMKKKTGLKQLN